MFVKIKKSRENKNKKLKGKLFFSVSLDFFLCLNTIFPFLPLLLFFFSLIPPPPHSQAMVKIKVIMAITPKGGVGNKGGLPWAKYVGPNGKTRRLPLDMQNFAAVTKFIHDLGEKKMKNACVMGGKTWKDIPKSFRPLDERLNVLLSSRGEAARAELEAPDSVLIFTSLDEAIEKLSAMDDIETIWICGGVQLYNEMIVRKFIQTRVEMGPNMEAEIFQFQLDELYLTRVMHEFECDTFISEEVLSFINGDIAKYLQCSETVEDNGISTVRESYNFNK